MTSRRTTIKDVAARSGVSITTVSHVLNEVAGKRVSDATRERVFRAAEELGYRPNRLAQGLRTQRTGMIGFLSDEILTTPYAGRMIMGAQDAAQAGDVLLLVLNSDDDPVLAARQLDALLERDVDGLVYATYYHRVVAPPAQLRQLPSVLLDARTDDDGLSSVVPDEIGGSRAAVEELLAAGHRRIGFLNNADDIPAKPLRLVGYRTALAAYGVDFVEELVMVAPSNTRGAFAAATALLTATAPPTALFCATDLMAMGAYQAVHELGLRIPDDVSVVGFDDQELVADSLRPGLTTVALPHYAMGRWAVETLLRQIADPTLEPQHEIAGCPLVRRSSVAPPARTRITAAPVSRARTRPGRPG